MNPFSPIPLLDFRGAPLVALLFLLLLWLQRRPLRKPRCDVWRRLLRNFAFALPGFALLRLTMVPIPLLAALWAQKRGFGLLNWLDVPPLAGAILGIVLFDYAYWWWHYAMHKVPLLWRFHNVHHTDLDLDVSTAARFHFGEIVLSVPFRVATALLIGIAPLALIVFEIVFECATEFHHSNWRLPLRFERALNRVMVTPRMHGVHHSIVRRETDSNWGTIFSWWDRLHRTLRLDVSQDAIDIGVPAYRDEEELAAAKLWLMPFRAQRPWQLPGGEVPEREIKPAKELAE